MKPTFLRALMATTALVVSPGLAKADSIKDSVPAETLASYCTEQGVGSETNATLTLGDGTALTGSIECEQQDLSVASNEEERADDLDDDDDEDDDEDAGDDDEGEGEDDEGEGEDDGETDDNEDGGDGGDDGKDSQD